MVKQKTGFRAMVQPKNQDFEGGISISVITGRTSDGKPVYKTARFKDGDGWKIGRFYDENRIKKPRKKV